MSKELRGARQLVANTLTFLGYEPVWQDIFGTEGCVSQHPESGHSSFSSVGEP